MVEQTAKHFSIDHWHVVDSECTPPTKYYIREVLDSASAEHTRSKLTNQQRREIISELGLDTLTAVLDDCFRGAGRDPVEYNAKKCADLEMFFLRKSLERSKQI